MAAAPHAAGLAFGVLMFGALGIVYTCFARRVRGLFIWAHRQTRRLLHAIPFPFPQPLGVGGIRIFGVLFLAVAVYLLWCGVAGRHPL